MSRQGGGDCHLHTAVHDEGVRLSLQVGGDLDCCYEHAIVGMGLGHCWRLVQHLRMAPEER